MTEATSAIPFSVWRKIAMATWRPRTDPTISATIDIEAPQLLAYIDQLADAIEPALRELEEAAGLVSSS